MDTMVVMKINLLVLSLIVLVGCATKIRTPLNRLMSPETVGGSLNTEVQMGKAGSAQGRLDVSESAPYPMLVSVSEGNQYFTALSLYPSFDLFWNHFSSSNSMFGIRYQIMGTPQTSNPQGYNLSFTAAIGGNEYESESDPKLKFELGGRDFSIIQSYWIWSFLSFYHSVFYSKYELTGDLSSSNDPTLDAKFNQNSTNLGTNIGAQLKLFSYNFKIEYCLNRVKWSVGKAENITSLGMSLGATF
jgi:hypothetical protein